MEDKDTQTDALINKPKNNNVFSLITAVGIVIMALPVFAKSDQGFRPVVSWLTESDKASNEATNAVPKNSHIEFYMDAHRTRLHGYYPNWSNRGEDIVYSSPPSSYDLRDGNDLMISRDLGNSGKRLLSSGITLFHPSFSYDDRCVAIIIRIQFVSNYVEGRTITS